MATAVLEIQRASLNAREAIKDLRNMAAALGCQNQVNKLEVAINLVSTVEAVLAMTAEQGDFVAIDPMRGAA